MGDPARDLDTSTHLLEAPTEVVFRGFRVVPLVAGASPVTTRGALMTIGAAPGCDVVLDHPAVSRHHCELEVTRNGLRVSDLGSKNGTFVDGIRIERAYVTAGRIIAAGPIELRVELVDDVHREPLEPGDHLDDLLGASTAMRLVFAKIARVAVSAAAVLLEGETGTGKSKIARSIHRLSPRAEGPYVVVDCTAIPETLFESELFGHEKGAFTGAHALRIGALEAAHGGTVFLDEIGELPAAMQPKLLRVLEDRTIKRVGSNDDRVVDVRFMAATNRDLRTEVNAGRFRADLFYRLDTVRIRVPALRERASDIAQLASHFWAQLAPGETVPAALVSRMLRRPWPGNVRELRAVVERAVVLGLDEALPAEVDDAAPTHAGSYAAAREQKLAEFERTFVADLIAKHGGNLSAAGREAGIDRNHLRRLARKHGVKLTP
jgi:two-component system, NtrC family, response regulator GlrR